MNEADRQKLRTMGFKVVARMDGRNEIRCPNCRRRWAKSGPMKAGTWLHLLNHKGSHDAAG